MSPEDVLNALATAAAMDEGEEGAAEEVEEAAAAAAAAVRARLNNADAVVEEIPMAARLSLAEDCLSLLLALLTELPRPPGRASARGALRREVVHRLASSECTHSEVSAVVRNLTEVRWSGWGMGGRRGGGGGGYTWCLLSGVISRKFCVLRSPCVLL